MRITDIEILPYSIQLKEPFVISLGAATHANNLALKIKTDEGLVGWGECSPYLPINGESSETGLVVGGYLKKALLGMDPLNIAGVHEIMDKVIFGNSSIKSALDMALYDIAAKNENVPLYKYLGAKQSRVLVTDY